MGRTNDMFLVKKYSQLIAVLAIFGLAGAACGSTGPSNQPKQSSTTATSVEVVNIAYEPPSLEIEVGTEVVWTNQAEGVRHTATSGVPGEDSVPGVSEGKPSRPDGIFDGDLADASSTFRFTFEDPGTYKYFCRIHPSMTGEIIVD